MEVLSFEFQVSSFSNLISGAQCPFTGLIPFLVFWKKFIVISKLQLMLVALKTELVLKKIHFNAPVKKTCLAVR